MAIFSPEMTELIEIGKLIGLVGGAALLFARLGRMAGRFEQIGVQQAAEIENMGREIKEIGLVVVQVAVQKAEMAAMAGNIAMLMKWYDELRHGKGIIHD